MPNIGCRYPTLARNLTVSPMRDPAKGIRDHCIITVGWAMEAMVIRRLEPVTERIGRERNF